MGRKYFLYEPRNMIFFFFSLNSVNAINLRRRKTPRRPFRLYKYDEDEDAILKMNEIAVSDPQLLASGDGKPQVPKKIYSTSQRHPWK